MNTKELQELLEKALIEYDCSGVIDKEGKLYYAITRAMMTAHINAEKEVTIRDNHEFYMVTCKGDKGSKCRHTSFDYAIKEAHRIAAMNQHPTWIVGVVAKVEVESETHVQTNLILK